MPRVGLLPGMFPNHATDVGAAVLAHLKMIPADVQRTYVEPNGKGLFLDIKTVDGRHIRRLLVDADGHPTETAVSGPPVEVLKGWLDAPDLTPQQRAGIESLIRDWEQPEDSPSAAIRSVFDLESIFAKPEPITYLINPEIPERSVVYLAGDSESGKSTLACAWGRDLWSAGHGVLLLDRDRNPRSVIQDRLTRLGMSPEKPFLVWDGQQRAEVPQPDEPIILDWCRAMVQRSDKPPLVILDSLIGFLPPDQTESNSADMRSLYNRCRAVNQVGGTVLLIHHLGHNGAPRGSSDFRPAADQGFLVTNQNPDSSRLLSRVRLQVDKSRYGLVTDIHYDYADGRMIRSEAGAPESESAEARSFGTADVMAKLTALLSERSGIGTREFVLAAKAIGVPKHRSLGFLADGTKAGSIHCEIAGRKHSYRLASLKVDLRD